MADRDELVRLWNQLDLCDPCRHVDYAKPESKPPGRPFLPPKDAPLLFIGEAPPSSGGFWKCGNGDGLRSRLLPLLPAWPNLDPDTEAALEWFVEAGYFFVQAMKWPLKDSYNQSAPSSRALQHATACHLGDEIQLINPRGIVALGGAAWDACSMLSEKHGLVLPDRVGVDGARLRHHEFRLAPERHVPFHVTRLPGKRNDGFGWARAILGDVDVFLGCDPKIKGCERAYREPAPPGRSHRTGKRDGRAEDKAAREMLRRLKKANLWPPPSGQSFDEVVAELEHREQTA